MPRKQHKYHFIYKTTCLLNESYYVGMHSTSNLEDGYLGSGKRLHYSVNKHGEKNFKREILEHFENREELKKREAELVNDDLLKDPKCMNLQHGGGGGFANEEHRKKCSDAGLKAFKNKIKTDVNLQQQYKELGSVSMKAKWKEGKLYHFDWTGLHHSEESKKKISDKSSARQQGSDNTNFGMKWLFNEELKQNKKVKPELVEEYLNNGWKFGSKNIYRNNIKL